MKYLEKKTLLMKWIEEKEGVSLEELLRKLYIDDEKSIREVANEIGVHFNTVSSWLKKMEIETRLPHQKLLEVVQIKRKLEKEEK